MTGGEPASRRPRAARFAAGLLLGVAFVPLWLWCLGAIWFSGLGTPLIRTAAAIVFALSFPIAWYLSGRRRTVAVVFFATVVAMGGLWTLKRPSHDRLWARDMVVMPAVEIDGDLVHVRNIRNCNYRSSRHYTVHYYDATFDLNRLRTADFLVEPIWEFFEGSAHTMLTFGFDDDRYLAISVELRREQEEGFHPVAGMFKQFELMYVIGDERGNLIRLRTNYRKDRCYLYPVAATPEVLRALFVDMVERADGLRERPEFYHTFLSSCTTNIVDHVNRIVPGQVPLSHEVFLPGYSGRLAYDLGLIDTDVSFEETQRRCRIDERAQAIGDDPRFSQLIRGVE